MDIAQLVTFSDDVDASCRFLQALTGVSPREEIYREETIRRVSIGGVDVLVRTTDKAKVAMEPMSLIVIHTPSVEQVEARLKAAGVETGRFEVDSYGLESLLTRDASGQTYLVRRSYALPKDQARAGGYRAAALLPPLARRAAWLWTLLLHPSNPLDLTDHAKAITRTIMGAAGRTASCAMKLLDDRCVQEALSLFRSYLEQLVNSLYLRIADDKERSRFYALSVYRVRTLMNDQAAGIFPFVPKEIRNLSAEQCAALLHCNDKGRPLGWSTLGREARVRKIEQQSGKNYEILRIGLSYFDDSSEASHGTIYGMALGSLFLKRGISNHGIVDQGAALMQWAQELGALVVGTTLVALPEFLETAHDEKLRVSLAEIEREFRDLTASIRSNNPPK